MFDFSNFHDATRASFTACDRPSRKPDYTSESGSQYWDTGEGAIRHADHWCDGIRSCCWLLDGQESSQDVAAYCAYIDFQPRALEPVYHAYSKSEIRLIEDLLEQGGAVRASDWTTGTGRFTKSLPTPWGVVKTPIKDAPDWVRDVVPPKTRVVVYIYNPKVGIAASNKTLVKIKTGKRYL